MALSADTTTSFSMRVDAYATVVVVGSLLFGFSATTVVAPFDPSIPYSEARFVASSVLLTGTLTASAFAVVASSLVVYQSLHLTAEAFLAALDNPAATSDDVSPSMAPPEVDWGCTPQLPNPRLVVERYLESSKGIRAWARSALYSSFLMYFAASGVERAVVQGLIGQMLCGATLAIGGVSLTVVFFLLKRRFETAKEQLRGWEKLHRRVSTSAVKLSSRPSTTATTDTALIASLNPLARSVTR
jgi:hypothetical protein